MTEDEYDDIDDCFFDEEDAKDPEYEPCPDGLGLPSEYDRDEREDFALTTLADIEMKLRIGLAFDQLDALRLAIKHRAAHIEYKRKNARGHKANAFAQQDINRADLRAQVLADRYNHNFARICGLQPLEYDAAHDATPGRRLQRIDPDKDLRIPNVAAVRTLHDSKTPGSWLWGVHGPVASTNTPVDQVQWFRAKADKDRADEAVNRICAEFRRTAMGYQAYADMWDASARARAGGERAFAFKTAAMWSAMAETCERTYHEARRPGVPAGQLDQTRVSQPASSGVAAHIY
ncbi:hypothetical protein C2E23DRAFT_729264 [Lenzites betulinus]|nr:hypothetical protein C2E23DRAFT_729264 [Lenzites betulinus]